MKWRSSGCGRLGLILGALVWVAPVSGWARVPKKAPDEAKLPEADEFKGTVATAVTWATPGGKTADEAELRKAGELKNRYEELSKIGKYNEAASAAMETCAILERELGGQSLKHLKCLNDLGSLYRRCGMYGRSQALHEQALSIGEKTLGSDHPHVADSLSNLAVLYEEQGEYEKAMPMEERAFTIRKKVLDSNHLDVADSLNNLAILYKKMGKYEKAVPLYERALAIREKALGLDHLSVANSLNNLAMLHADWGEYQKAISIQKRAVAIREKTLNADHPDVANGLGNLASLYREQGNYGKAEPLYQRALSILEKTLGPNHPNVGVALNNLATLYYHTGEYRKSIQKLEQALAILERAFDSSHPRVATGLNNLAWLYYHQKEYGKSRSLHNRALAIREKTLGPDHPDVAISLNNLALVCYKQGEYEKAKSLHERALIVREKALGSDHLLVGHDLNNLAGLYVEQGEYEKAKLLLEQALAILQKTLGPEHPDVAHGLNNLAMVYDEQNNHGSALDLHRRAFEVQEINLVRTLTVADEARRIAFASTLSGSLHYALSLHLRVASEHNAIAELALTTLLRRKNRVQDLVTQSNTALRRSLPEDDRHLLDDLSDVDSRIAVLSSRGPGMLGVEAYSRQLDELRKERDRMWSELAKHSALVEALAHPITIEDVQQTLPAGSALIELIKYDPRHDDAGTSIRKHETKPPPRYAAYLVFSNRFDWVDLGPAAPIDEHVKAFRKALQTKQAVPTDLYDAVMRPIVEKLGSTHHLIIAPAGTLSLIPFGALHDGERYLVEKYELRYVTTGRDLLEPPASSPVITTPVTIVANPTGAFLPDAETEADFLEGFFPDTRVLRGDQATETNVRTVERPLVLHMATHGFFGEARNERDNPMFRSGLYLADIEQVEVDRELDDGQLTAYEVSGMDLRGTQLVVLSACDTGMGAAVEAEGKVLMSEGVSGLRRAFAMAGARTTVMSLWEVSGVTAQTTMEAYYRKLAEGQGPGEAMQAVQLEMLRTKEHAHPKDWAVFIVSGDDDPLVFPTGQEPREVEEGPPQTEGKGRGGCATRSSGRGAPTGSMLIGLLGLTALRRRGR